MARSKNLSFNTSACQLSVWVASSRIGIERARACRGGGVSRGSISSRFVNSCTHGCGLPRALGSVKSCLRHVRLRHCHFGNILCVRPRRHDRHHLAFGNAVRSLANALPRLLTPGY